MINNNGTRKLSPAKLRGNKVHQQLKRLCFLWMKDRMPKQVERLRREAKRKVGV